MNAFWEGIVTIATAIVGLGIVAVLVSRRAQTPAVIQSAGSAFGNSMAVAEAPVTGAQTPINLSYPGSMFNSGAGGGFGS